MSRTAGNAARGGSSANRAMPEQYATTRSGRAAPTLASMAAADSGGVKQRVGQRPRGGHPQGAAHQVGAARHTRDVDSLRERHLRRLRPLRRSSWTSEKSETVANRDISAIR